jgi:hypothetical protein
MPRFFFDLNNGEWDRDELGSEFADLDQAIAQTKRTLPAIALDELPRDRDYHTVTIQITDENRQPVYTATLTYAGLLMKG